MQTRYSISSNEQLYRCIAYGSAVETAELLELSGELHLLSMELTASTLERCRLCQRLLRGLINHLRIT